LIASGKAKERFRKAIYAEAASGAKDDHDFTPPREYLGVYLERAARAAFSSTTRSVFRAATRWPTPNRRWRITIFFGAPHVAIIHTDEPLGIYGAIDCGAYVSNFMLAAQALGLALSRRRHWRGIPD